MLDKRLCSHCAFDIYLLASALTSVAYSPQQAEGKGYSETRTQLFLFSSSCHLSFFPVPIIPTFLYAIEHQTQERPSAAPSEAQLVSVLSLYDNNTYTVSTANLTISSGANGSSGVNGSSAERHGCKEDSEFLEEENVRVGLLFASKAMVQLMVNPFVGPLTNRYIHAE
ncbi:hypothetical protein M9458_018165 [Cirrhinus mrigala]|uniref:Uncharacterized protein n=1 Tax=Cirrhinus mrigala TaxID=683832 RepID=A0ABD0QJU5_CIRMR